MPSTHCQFVPPHIIDTLARHSGLETAGRSPAQSTAVVSKQIRDAREAHVSQELNLTDLMAAQTEAVAPGKARRKIHDARNTYEFDVALARDEGGPESAQDNVNDAYDHAGAARDFFADVLDRDSIDNAGMDINVNVNFGVDFLNAFWDGERIVLGNGDGQTFVDFARSADVMGHELSHGVVEYTSNLDYYSQSGALNESFADVFGSLIEQRLRGQDFDSANWLIGDEIMAPALYGEALRSMAHPGTAYDNPVLGRDPQPAHMKDYYAGPADRQGVHINSGIPNRAFYLTAQELGTGGAGMIWYAGLQNLWPTARFSDAAAVLSAQARILARDGRVPRQAAQSVRAAFREVGVV